jgi:hypothetical protein
MAGVPPSLIAIELRGVADHYRTLGVDGVTQWIHSNVAYLQDSIFRRHRTLRCFRLEDYANGSTLVHINARTRRIGTVPAGCFCTALDQHDP